MLSRQPAFSEKISLAQNAQGRFLANLRNHCEPNFTFLDIKYRVGRVPLRKDGFFLGKRHNFPALANRGKKLLRVELAIDLGRHSGCHQGTAPSAGYTYQLLCQSTGPQECSLLLTIAGNRMVPVYGYCRPAKYVKKV